MHTETPVRPIHTAHDQRPQDATRHPSREPGSSSTACRLPPTRRNVSEPSAGKSTGGAKGNAYEMRFRYDPPVICPLTDGQEYSSVTAVEGGVVALGGE